MASFERYYSSGVTSAETTIHTSNASDAAQADIVIGMTISNSGLSEATASAYISGAGATDVYLARDVVIPKSGSVEVVQGKIVLDNTDIVKVKASAGQVDVWLSVLDNAAA